jgi:predicted nucleic acid-binding protein
MGRSSCLRRRVARWGSGRATSSSPCRSGWGAAHREGVGQARTELGEFLKSDENPLARRIRPRPRRLRCRAPRHVAGPGRLVEALAAGGGDAFVADTAPLLYRLEGRSPSGLERACDAVFEAVEAGALTCLVSSVTVAEIFAGVYRLGEAQAAVTDAYLSQPSVAVVPVSRGSPSRQAGSSPAGDWRRLADALIAATANDLELPLLTADRDPRASGVANALDSRTLREEVHPRRGWRPVTSRPRPERSAATGAGRSYWRLDCPWRAARNREERRLRGAPRRLPPTKRRRSRLATDPGGTAHARRGHPMEGPSEARGVTQTLLIQQLPIADRRVVCGAHDLVPKLCVEVGSLPNSCVSTTIVWHPRAAASALGRLDELAP